MYMDAGYLATLKKIKIHVCVTQCMEEANVYNVY